MTREALEGFPLSLQQRHVWRLQQERAAYGAQCAVLLTGHLNRTALQEAIQHVVQRHEILRTTFQSVAGLEFPLQVIAERASPGWQELDLRDVDQQEQAAHFDALLQHERRTPYDDAHGPLLRCCFVTLAAEQHLLLISLSALCADAWTLTHLVQDIGQAYAAYPRQDTRPEVPLQYADFVAWQQDILADAAGEAGRAYWRTHDLAATAVLTLPGVSRPVGSANVLPQTLPVTFAVDALSQIEALAQQYETSVAVCLLACWQTLLWRLTGQSDVCVAYVCDGRKYEELHGALGPFARTFPVQGHFTDDTRLSGIIGQLHQTVHDASAWLEYYPEQHSPETGLAVGFSFVERCARRDYGNVGFAVQQHYSCSERFQLHLTCERTEDTLLVALHYDPHCVPAEDMARLADRLTTLLQSMTTAPQARLSEVEILSATERQQVLVTWNDTSAAAPAVQCVPQLFEMQVSQTPDAIAVVCGEASLTYQALNERANRVARHLQAMGVGPEVLVGIGMERSLDLVVAVLGTLKAGGAYVPFDPAYPRERLDFMLADAQVRVLLTQEGLVSSLSAQRAPVLCLDADWPSIARHSADNLPPQLAPQNLAYVIYTSGSTGEPRGVMITQANICHYVHALRVPLELTATDRYLHTASVAFSSSVRQLLLPLAHGATVVMATAEHLRDPLALCQIIQRHQVTVLDIMPSYWRTLVHTLGCLTPESRQALLDNGLRLLLSASEPLAADVSGRWAEALQHPARLINMFGQTETTGIVAVYPLSSQDDTGPIVPIGRPIASTQVYLLNAHLRPVPIGVPGELCVGGMDLGRGYLHHPELAAQKFVPHPYSTTPGARLYKTGDLARYRPDGTIAFLGRIDHQIKIRGVRIEPGEIEAILSQHPAVAAAVVVAREETSGDRRLVAYVVPRTEGEAGTENAGVQHQTVPQEPSVLPIPDLSVGGLQDFLQEKLPAYMVPAAFVMLASMPLTPNGKVDRQALPAPDQDRSALAKAFVAPRNPIEEAVTRIWAEVLGREQVGINDNFFALGGHSLLAAQVIYRLREVFLVDLPLRSLFEDPTVTGVAAVIMHQQIDQAEQARISQTLADIEQLSADEIHTLLAVEDEERNRHETSC